MKIKKIAVLFIFLIVVGGILVFSTWNQWTDNQKTILARMKPILPIAEFNHGAWIQGIAFSPTNPDLVVSASKGNEVKVWNKNNPDAPQLLLTSQTDKIAYHFIDCLAFSPKGEWVASKTYKTLYLWNMPEGTKLNSIEMRSFTAGVSPVMPLLTTALNDVKLWDISNPKEITEMFVLPPKKGAQALTFEEARTIQHKNETVNQKYEKIVFSHDGKWIAASGQIYDRTAKMWRDKVKVWDLQSKQLVKILERKIPDNPEPEQHHNKIQSIKFSHDSRFFGAAANNGLTIWSIPEWNIYHEILDQKISDVAFSSDGKMFAVADIRQITLWSLNNITPIAILKARSFLANVDVVMVFSQDGNTLAGGGFDGVLRLWDMRKIDEE